MTAAESGLVDRLRVLVVDDSRDGADSLSMMIGLWGHLAQTAYGGAAALAMIQSFRPDVVIADLAMPGMDGLELARQLRSLGVDCPALIAVSGHASEEHRTAATAAGYDVYFAKPADPAELRRLLEQAVSVKRHCRRSTELLERGERLVEESRELLAEIRAVLHEGT